MANELEIKLKLAADQFAAESRRVSQEFRQSIDQITSADKQREGQLLKNAVAEARLTSAQRERATVQQRLSAARDNLGITSIRDQERAVQLLTASYNRLRRDGNLSSREVAQAQQALRREVARVRGEVDNQSAAFAGLGRRIGAFIGVGAAIQLSREILAANDDYKRLNSQLRLVTDSEEDLADVNEKLFRVAQDTRSEFEPVVSLYTRLARSTQSLGLSQDQLLDLVTLTTQALRVSGATTQESSSAILQFSQALQSGVLRGEEFNALTESAPRLLQALADGMGVPIEALRAMAEAGELTRDRIIAALTSQTSVMQEEFAKLAVTVQEALTGLTEAFRNAVANGDLTPLVESIVSLIEVVSDPATIEGLSRFASGIAGFTGLAVSTASEIGQWARRLGEDFGRIIAGPLSEIGVLDQRIQRLKETLGDTFTLGVSTGAGADFVSDLSPGRVDDKVVQEKIAQLQKLKDAKLAALGIETEAEKQARDKSLLEEKKKAKEIAGIEGQIDAAKQQLSALQAKRAEDVRKIEVAAERAKGQELLKQLNDQLRNEEKAINDRLKLAEDAGRKVIDVERKIADERRRIEDIDAGVEDKIFERSLGGLSPKAQEKEIEERATQKLIEAEKALRQGRLGEAAEKSQDVQALSDRVQNTERANALLKAGAEVEKKVSEQNIKSREAEAKSLREFQSLQREAAALEKEALDGRKAEIVDLTEKVKKLGEIDPTIEIDSNIDELLAKVAQLQNSLANVQAGNFRTGGQVGSKIQKFQSGGNVGKRQLILAEDGEWHIPKSIVDYYGAARLDAMNAMKLPRYREGGKLPGWGGGDRRLLAPETGSYILRKEAGRYYGDRTISALLTKALPRFNMGGQIRINPGLLSLPELPAMMTGGAVAASPVANNPPTQRHEIVINQQPFNVFGEQDQIRGLVNAITEVARGG